jgi:lipoprotein
MKKFFAILAVCVTTAAAFASCKAKKDGTGKQAQNSLDSDIMSGNTDISSNGSDKAATDYSECFFREKSGETYYTLTSPDEYIKKLKNDAEWEDLISDFNYDQEIFCANYEVKSKEVKKESELTDNELASAESYFEELYNCSVEAISGYEYSVKAEVFAKDYGEESKSIKFCVVNLGEGWKIIENSAADLKDYYSE